MGDLLRVFPLLTSKNEKKIADKQTMNNSPKVPGNALDVSETENIFLAFLFQGLFFLFLAITTGNERVQIIAYSTHTAHI